MSKLETELSDVDKRRGELETELKVEKERLRCAEEEVAKERKEKDDVVLRNAQVIKQIF